MLFPLGKQNPRGFNVAASDSRGFGIDSDELTGFPESQSASRPLSLPHTKQGREYGRRREARDTCLGRRRLQLRLVKNIGFDGNLGAVRKKENGRIRYFRGLLC